MVNKNQPAPSTLIDILHRRATQHPERRAYTFLVDSETQEECLTCGELDRQARAIGALLQAVGTEGEGVLLLYPPGLEYIAAFWGCLCAGMVAVPTYPPRLNWPDPRLHTIAADAKLIVLPKSN